MTAKVEAIRLDGKLVSQTVLEGLKAELTQLKAVNATLPKLVVILVGDDPASQVYTGKKTKIAQEIGMESELLTFPESMTEDSLYQTLKHLNGNPAVHGILVQLPLPSHINTQRILEAVAPEKDVDGFNPLSLGRLVEGEPIAAKPCTPAGMMTLLNHYNIPIEGKHAVVVGRSTIVGKPMAMLLLAENATVSMCHSKTKDLKAFCREADILVAAVGRPEMITGEMIKPGAVVLDVGINRIVDGDRKGKLVGDVHYASASQVAGYITPVPGGVGPMTIATLMQNTLALYRAAQTGSHQQ